MAQTQKPREVKVYDRFNPPKRTGIRFKLPSMTDQTFKEECDINAILRRHGLAPLNHVVPVWGDFSEVGSYQEAHERLLAADEAFNELPAELWLRFRNNAGELLGWLEEPGNREEAISLGLLRQKPKAGQPAPPGAAPVTGRTPEDGPAKP